MDEIKKLTDMDYRLIAEKACYVIAGEAYIRIEMGGGCIDIRLYENKDAMAEGGTVADEKIFDRIHYRIPCPDCMKEGEEIT